MALSPGTRIGVYEITAQIGAGGMGQVFRARDTKLQRDVALKILPDAFANDPDRLARFTREAQTLASLNHPNIAAIYGIEESGVRALAMELVEGEDLSEKIQGRREKGEGLPLDEVLTIAKQIADALEAAHEQGIIHRDLKPANIKIRADGTVKVLDFGLAKAMDRAGGASRAGGAGGETLANSPTLTIHATQAGIILGTAAYMSPEQAAGKPVDKRSDLWSFGIVVLEMLTGQAVFTGETVSHVLASVLKSDPDWTTLPETTPAPLRRLLRRCLEKDRRRRLDSAAAARLEIEEATTAGPAQVGRHGDGPATNDQRPTTILPWTIAAGALLVAAAAVVLWSPWRAEKPADRPLVRLDVDLGADVSLPAQTSQTQTVVISPDGTRIVYASGTPPQLFVRRLDQPKATELPGTQGAIGPFFSPDGQWVGFVSGSKVKKVSVDGGAVVPLTDVVSRLGGWGEDGSVLIQTSRGLQRIPPGGGPPETVAQPRDGELSVGDAQMLPGGKAVLLAADNPGPVDKTTIDVVTLASHARKTIVRGGASPRYVPTSNGAGHLLYVSGATLFAIPFDLNALETRGTAVPLVDDVAHEILVGAGQFDVTRTGTLVYRRAGAASSALRTVQWVDAAGKRALLRARPGASQDLSLSPDGTRVALTIPDSGSTDVWVYDPRRDAMTRVTFGGKVYRTPRWSPDGQYVVFSDVGRGLVQARADGASQPRALTQSATYEIASSFTPDGKWLAYSVNPDGGLWTVPLEDQGGQLKAGTPVPFLASGANDDFPSFSPDGRWLAYQSNESGATEVYVRAFPPPASGQGGRWQVSNSGGSAPHWSRSGHELLYQLRNQIMAAGYQVRGDTFVAEKPRVWLEKLDAAGNVNGLSWDLAPDGKRVAVVSPVESDEAPKPEHEVVFLLNFFDELRRRVPLQ